MQSPGKIILFGEHAVVYGKPGIAVPIKELGTNVIIEKSDELAFSSDRILHESEKHKLNEVMDLVFTKLGINNKIDIKIESTLPIASGMGSSASLCVALIKSLDSYFKLNLSIENISGIAFECEKIFHGSPSGLDNTVIAYEKPVYFKEGKTMPLRLKNQLNLIIADTGIKSGTKKVVGEVKNNYLENKDKINSIFNEIEAITNKARICLENGDVNEIGTLMIKNQRCLEELGVSSSKIELLTEIAIANEAYGAKLAGAGKGGNVVILAEEKYIANIVSEISSFSKNIICTTIK